LCTPAAEGEQPGQALRITAEQVSRLEGEIDAMNEELEPLNSFILPGGSPAAAHLHHARTVIRRAERLITHLAEHEPVNPQAIAYANRLSDHFFVLARALNQRGTADVLWVPGRNR
jgi:cob(I)alamin adenosyltransferase